MEHECSQTVNLKRIEKILFGNGQPGLIKDVNTLINKMESMEEHIEKLSTSYVALAQSQLEQDTIDKMKEKNSERWGRVLERSSWLFAIAGVIITAIITFGR